MKNMLVITGVAISLFASSAAFARGEGAAKAAETATEVFVPKIETAKGAKPGVKMEKGELSAKEARGVKTATATSLEQTAAEVQRSNDENMNVGATCSPSNLENVTLAQQTVLNEAAAIGMVVDATCFGNGKIQDLDAIDNGINTIAAATAEAKAQGASRSIKVRLLSVAKKAKIAARTLAAFASETGRAIAEAKPDFKQVGQTCLKLEPSVVSAL